MQSGAVSFSTRACNGLNKLLNAGFGDNYDFIFFHVSGVGYYTSTHMNTHQAAVSGTGTARTWFGNCGSTKTKGVTLMQPLAAGSMGPFFHEFFHQYAVHMGSLHPQLGTDSGGHWGWTAFQDHQGVLGGFNYFYCADGTTRFSMDATKDPYKASVNKTMPNTQHAAMSLNQRRDSQLNSLSTHSLTRLGRSVIRII